MSFPTSITTLPQIVQALDGTFSDVYHITNSTYSGTVAAYGHRLGTAKGGGDTTTLSPKLPDGHQIIARGAYPIAAPGAPTSVGVVSDTAYGLTQNGDYKWAVGNVTAYGDTLPGTQYHNSNIGGAGATCGYTLTLPSASQGTTDAPILFRRLYRSKTGGSTLYYVRDVPLLETTVTDIAGDDTLVQTAPASNTSGLTGNVTVTGTNGATSNVWTERAPGATLAAGDFIVDYGLGTAGGTVTFASADNALVPTITYTAASLLNTSLVQGLVTALKDVRDVLTGVQSANVAINSTSGNPLVVEVSGVDKLHVDSLGQTVVSGALYANQGFIGASNQFHVDGSGNVTTTGTIAGPVAATTLSASGASTLAALSATTLTASGHVSNTGSAPTLSIGSGVNGAGNTVAFIGATASSDRRGSVNVIPGASPGAGPDHLCRVIFATAFASAPHVCVTPANVNAATVGVYYNFNATTTFFDVYYLGTPTAALGHNFTYIVEG